MAFRSYVLPAPGFAYPSWLLYFSLSTYPFCSPRVFATRSSGQSWPVRGFLDGFDPSDLSADQWSVLDVGRRVAILYVASSLRSGLRPSGQARQNFCTTLLARDCLLTWLDYLGAYHTLYRQLLY